MTITEQYDKNATEIINSLEGYINELTLAQIRKIYSYGIYCNPSFVKGKWISPSEKTRGLYRKFSDLLFTDFVKQRRENEFGVMRRVYKHFYRDDNRYKWSGSVWAAGFIDSLLKSKSTNKKMVYWD